MLLRRRSSGNGPGGFGANKGDATPRLQLIDDRGDGKRKGRGLHVAGLTDHVVADSNAVLGLIKRAQEKRKVGETKMNKHSSRSHCVFTLTVASTRPTADGGTMECNGKLHLVDLAGSERVKKSEATGQAFEEAVAINNSLTTLGRCVQALAMGPKGGRPPFRETKLTRLLSNAFGGSAKTVLVVCVAPTASDTFETVNSLNFGQQARATPPNVVA